jgi:hypothetical protein
VRFLDQGYARIIISTIFVCECIGTHAGTLEKKRLILIILKFNIVDIIILAYPWSKNRTN